jgi:hypothetical protein
MVNPAHVITGDVGQFLTSRPMADNRHNHDTSPRVPQQILIAIHSFMGHHRVNGKENQAANKLPPPRQGCAIWRQTQGG